MPTFNIHITSPAPGLQHLSVSFTAAFPLQAAHSPLKKPNQAPRRPSPGSMQSPPGALTGSPGGRDTSSAGTGLLGKGASRADLDSVGTAAAPAQLAASSMGVEKAFTVTSSVGDGPGGAPRPDRLSNIQSGPPILVGQAEFKPSRRLKPLPRSDKESALHAERL